MAGVDPWMVTPQERARHIEQFQLLKPISGVVTGDQAKGFLLQSKLPMPILGQIWGLADADCDGKMTINEFSVACKLINLKLRGVEVPPVLPPSLKAVLSMPVPGVMPGVPPPAMSMGVSSVAPPHPPPPHPPPPHHATAPPHPPPPHPPPPHPMPPVQQQMPPVGMVQSTMASGGIMSSSVGMMGGGIPPTNLPLSVATSAYNLPNGPVVAAGQVRMPMPPMSAPMAVSMGMVPPMSMAPPMVPPMSAHPPMSAPMAPPAIPPMAPPMSAAPIQGPIPGHSSAGGTPVSDPRSQRSMSLASVESAGSIGSPLQEWAVPHQSKLKYTQLFNQNDRSKAGYILGPQARNIMVQTQLPQGILAQIWGLADLDSDGRLTCDEFVLALHLCDMAKAGDKIPLTLPPELVPPSFRRQRHDSIKSGSPALSQGGSDDLCKDDLRGSFEDKRKENFEKGQAELDRRRKALAELQKAEREERERKEREENDRRERVRLEQERRRQQELEKQLERQREIEQQKEEERRVVQEQRQAARREMERQRQLELEMQRRQELIQQQQREQEKVLQLKHSNQKLTLELAQLNEKVKDLSSKISETRTGVSTVKSTIDKMRTTRDSKMQQLNSLKNQLKDQNQRLLTLAQDRARMDARNKANPTGNPNSPSAVAAIQMLNNKQIALKQLKDRLQDLQGSIQQKQQDIENNNCQLNDLKQNLNNLVEECQFVYKDYEEKKNKILEMKGKKTDYSAAWNDSAWDDGSAAASDWPAADAGAGAATGDFVKYRALYEFKGRNQDELSFQPGDIILVPFDQNAEPGWFSGQVRGLSGWFPEAYVEKMSDAADDESAEQVDSLQVKRPLEGIQEVPENVSDNGSLAEAGAAIQQAVAAADSPVLDQRESVSSEQVEAVFACQGKNDKYLTFNQGDVITIKEQQGSWWFGELNGVEGWLPKSHVKPVGADVDYYVALYPYNSAEPGDLTFQQGEVVVVVKKDGDWWTGTVGDKTGIFPSNYVQKAASQKTSTQQQEVEAKVESAPTEAQPAPESEVAAEETEAPPPQKTAQAEEELDMKELQEIYMPPKSPKGKGKKPEIATVLAPYQATSTEQLSLQRGQLIMIRKKTQTGWWEGELQAKGKKRQVGWFPASYVKLMGSSSARSTPIREMMGDSSATTPTQQPDGSEQVVVLYPYTAQNEDELTIQKGDIITVLARTEPEWWKGEVKGVVGMFPSNYVEACYQRGPSGSQFFNHAAYDQLSPIEKKRQGHIHELINTEQTYVDDMSIINSAFRKPMHESLLLTDVELAKIFVNCKDVYQCNTKLLKAFRVRRKMCVNGIILMIGDILCENLVRMSPYIRFCSCQLGAAALIQHQTETSPDFCKVMKKCQMDMRTKGMPLSSFLIKPMQRITKYPLLIKKILEFTPENHPDRLNLEEALTKAEELCSQVNEGVRETENSERLEWMQTHINCDSLDEQLVFNSLTNALGPRKFIHHGFLKKAKSGKELVAFLLNDFLLLAQPNKPLGQTSGQFSFERNQNTHFRIYKKPIFLNEMMVMSDASMYNNNNGGAECEYEFSIQDLDRVYTLVATTASEKKMWKKKLEEARKNYLDTERCFLQRQQSKQAHFQACGRLLIGVQEGINIRAQTAGVRRRPPKGKMRVIVVEGDELFCKGANGKIDPYCEVSIGSQHHCTKVIPGSTNPKWNSNMQFLIKDVEDDVLCVTVYDRDLFAPNEFLGRTEVRVWDILQESRSSQGPITKRLLLHEVESGEVVMKLHLQLFDSK